MRFIDKLTIWPFRIIWMPLRYNDWRWWDIWYHLDVAEYNRVEALEGGLLNRIIAHGNRQPFESILKGRRATLGNNVECVDGFTLSVIAGEGTYCTPRPNWFGEAPANYPGPYRAVEVGFPSSKPRPWRKWRKYCEDPDTPTETVYGYVPVDLVRRLVLSHGGERKTR